MKKSKALLIIGLALSLGLLASPGNARVVFDIPGGTIYPMPPDNYGGTGPRVFSGITWQSSYENSLFGYTSSYFFGSNGIWNGALGPMAGLNTQVGSMMFTFATPVSAVGGFLNYAPEEVLAPVDLNIQPQSIPIEASMTSLDENNQILESIELLFNFDNTGKLNAGYFLGFMEDSDIIKHLVLANSYIGLTDLTILIQNGNGNGNGNGHPPAPLPSTLVLLGPALLGLAIFRSRAKQ